jgi:hypothetical protein
VALDEDLEESLGHRPKRAARARVFEARKHQLGGRHSAHRQLESLVEAKFVEVDAVLVAHRDAVHPLAQQRLQLVRHAPLAAAIDKARAKSLREPCQEVDLGKEQQPPVAGRVRLIEAHRKAGKYRLIL